MYMLESYRDIEVWYSKQPLPELDGVRVLDLLRAPSINAARMNEFQEQRAAFCVHNTERSSSPLNFPPAVGDPH